LSWWPSSHILCRLGLHRWEYGEELDVGPSGFCVITYAWCRFHSCEHNVPKIVNIDTYIRRAEK
jgi:hypothetical protein